jgi:GH24 family phage-related lysozyme (muramidase)
MTMEMSTAAEKKLTEPWEECVLYVYDDKVPKRHIDGKLQYPEWDGGPVRGTLTIGWGHTDAAGAPKIVHGMRITQDEADQIFARDMAPCVAHVNRLLKVPVTQHQFDALCDGDFNCYSMTAPLCALMNAGNARAVPAKMLQYTYSKGEHMDGLTHRRNAEIAWFNTPDHIEPAAPTTDPEVVFSPKAERNPPPKSIVSSQTATAAATMGMGGLGTLASAVDKLNQQAAPIIQAKQTVTDLGVFDHLGALANGPTAGIIIGAVIVALAAFVIFDRWQKLRNDHV